jgi:uncharacterized membrane protein
MIVFHIVFFLDFLAIVSFAYDQGVWHVLARTVQWSFLLLVGISMQLSYQRILFHGGSKLDFLKRNIFRGMIIFLAAILVTTATAFYNFESYIRFGVLHLIAVSVIFLGFIVNCPRFSFILALIIYLLSFPIAATVVSESGLLIFGFAVQDFYTLDYFPIFPWMAIPTLGISLGYFLLDGYQRHYPSPVFLESSRLALIFVSLGKRSLLIYLIHIPIILALLMLVQRFFF